MTSAQTDFPHAQTLVRIAHQCLPKRDPKEPPSRYFISSMPPDQQTPQQWLNLIRGHWAGVENRNHWRKDACLLEDKTRSKNPRIVANLILLRNALFKLFHHFSQDELSLPATVESINQNPTRALNLISEKL